jgi:hypothetical protein
MSQKCKRPEFTDRHFSFLDFEFKNRSRLEASSTLKSTRTSCCTHIYSMIAKTTNPHEVRFNVLEDTPPEQLQPHGSETVLVKGVKSSNKNHPSHASSPATTVPQDMSHSTVNSHSCLVGALSRVDSLRFSCFFAPELKWFVLTGDNRKNVPAWILDRDRSGSATTTNSAAQDPHVFWHSPWKLPLL